MKVKLYSSVGLMVSAALAGTPAFAQESASPDAAVPVEASEARQSPLALGRVTVTARKREESLQDVPLAVNAYDAAFIDTFKIDSVENIANYTPGLISGDANTGVAGRIYLRGIGSSADSGLVDGAVSINVDGVQVGGQIMRAATFDLGQIEVLRGPQALFFGKNSPGGVISLKSAMPTESFEFSATAGYEFEGDEVYLESYVSGPLTDTLSGRIAAKHSDTEGYWDFVSREAPPAALGVRNDRGPDQTDYVIRGVLVFEPTSNFRATTTHTVTKLESNQGVVLQRVACATGTAITIPGFGDLDDCEVNETVVTGDLYPSQLAVSPDLRNMPMGYIDNEQYLGTLTMDWDITNALKLTSVTGLYDATDASSQNFSLNPVPFIFATPLLDTEQFSQEVRLASSYDSWFNFVVGGYYEDSTVDSTLAIPAVLIGSTPFSETVVQDKEVVSAFAQLLIEPSDQFEIALGGRYSEEEKSGVVSSTAIPGASAPVSASWDNFSPEVAVQYMPSASWNFYVSYKEGFKSGGLDAGSQIPTAYVASYLGGMPINIEYDQELAEGFEGGVKYSSPSGDLQWSIAAFAYDYTGLQLTRFDPASLAISVDNAGSASTKGAEFDFKYSPPSIDGFGVYGTVAYLDGQYDRYIADCYGGQSFAQGCNLKSDPAMAGFDRQDLSGIQLKNAPEWTATLGGIYDTYLGDFLLSTSADVNYSSSYNPNSENAPITVQDDFVKLNATISFGPQDERWQVALIGNNLTNEFVVIEASKEFISGGAALQGTSVSYPVDYFGNVIRGREIRLEASVRF